jgi:predicted flap endonuclease-1-like 5' DNA nuclease
MALADEMRRLTRRLGEDHDRRTAAVSGIRATVARELGEFRTDRQAEAEAQRQELRVYMVDLDSQVARARSDTVALLADLGAARENLSREQQHKLAADIGALRGSMDALRDEWNATRRAVAQGQQAELSAHMDALARWVIALRKDATALRDRLEVAHQGMADEQRLNLAQYVNDMRGQVDQLLDDADQAMAAQRAALQSMADAQRQQLAEDDQSLRGEVRAFRTQIGAELQEISADQAEARQVWAHYGLMRQHVEGRPQESPRAPEPPAQEEKLESLTDIVEPAASEPPTPTAESTLPESGAMDDLRVISGIGLSMERRLHQAGIYRYAQLAAMTAEELRLAAGAEPFVKVERWIEQARELTEQE